MGKERIDVILTKRGFAPSREKARAIIMAGQVFSGSERILKPDKKIEEDIPIEVRGATIPFVSYGGVKLDSALKRLGVTVMGLVALDIGSSTGGFVDCLLQNGASKVYAVDVGIHQLHHRLSEDKRVILKEGVNARYLKFDHIGEKVDLITVDVSFISLKKILPAAIQFLKETGRLISLVKPQFEVGRYEVGKGGVVKDITKIERALEEIQAFGKEIGLQPIGMVESPREREKKNREYFILWAPSGHQNR
ncbi:MAG: TlyA family RNA methyltransferase [Syntrophorhabdaceae bacterium]|nr:TlyA family RNA methyltransferase [Syntrophorhabdaceae bacterium]